MAIGLGGKFYMTSVGIKPFGSKPQAQALIQVHLMINSNLHAKILVQYIQLMSIVHNH